VRPRPRRTATRERIEWRRGSSTRPAACSPTTKVLIAVMQLLVDIRIDRLATHGAVAVRCSPRLK